MSSSRARTLSFPNRLGHGIARRKPTSIRPRKAATATIVNTIDHRSDQPCTA
jgi:hypothetical protein